MDLKENQVLLENSLNEDGYSHSVQNQSQGNAATSSKQYFYQTGYRCVPDENRKTRDESQNGEGTRINNTLLLPSQQQNHQMQDGSPKYSFFSIRRLSNPTTVAQQISFPPITSLRGYDSIEK